MVKRDDVCTFGFLCSGGPVAGPSDRMGGIHKAESVKNDWNHPRLPSIVMDLMLALLFILIPALLIS